MKTSNTPALHSTEPLPGQSTALLQALHLLTRDGKLNQDSARKLKQVKHLIGFIKPLVDILLEQKNSLSEKEKKM